MGGDSITDKAARQMITVKGKGYSYLKTSRLSCLYKAFLYGDLYKAGGLSDL